MQGLEASTLIDVIHEAALVPTLWPKALDDIGAAVGGNGGVLFAVRDGYQGAVYSDHFRSAMELFLKEGWAERDLTLRRAAALNHGGFLSETDLLTEEELATDQVYVNFFRVHDFCYRAGTIIPMPVGDSAAFVVPRTAKQGPVSREMIRFLDSLRPHLARSALTANRLGFARARARADALQALGLPGAVVRGEGRLFAANDLFEALVPSLFLDRRRRVGVTDAAADALLAEALTGLARHNAKSVKSIPVAASAGHVPMVLHLIPVRGAAHDIFTQASALLVVTPVDRAAVPTAEVLQGLFDLTPAEARVARGIGTAQSVDDLAVSMNVSRETVRTQLKAVLGKTGVNRQAELVALLAGKALSDN